MRWIVLYVIARVGGASHDLCTQTVCVNLLQRSSNTSVTRLAATLLNGDANGTSEDVLQANPLALSEKDASDSKQSENLYHASIFTVSALPVFFILLFVLVWYCYKSDQSASDKVFHELLSKNESGKVYAYNNEPLLTWGIFLVKTPSIVWSWQVWVVVPCVLGTAYGFVLMVENIVPYIDLGTETLDEFGRYLRVFIAFMLGLFMNNSFSRWQSSVSSFRQTLTGVKQMMWTLRLMNVQKALVDELERKCVLACYILEAEMRTDLGSKAADWKEQWDATWNSLRESELLTAEEEEVLRKNFTGLLDIEMGSHSMLVWSWIGQVITKVKQEPGVLVPMYIRLVSACNTCLGLVDKLKTCVQVQVPFTYAYLLSMIVHLNNVLLAVCSGIQIGASLLELKNKDVTPASAQAHHFHAANILTLQSLILLIQPVMYQSCLVIAHVLNHPFGDHQFQLPTETYILLMRDELKVLAVGFDHNAPHPHREHPHDDSSGDSDSSGGGSGGGDEGDDGDDC